jgi:hypothetical protein
MRKITGKKRIKKISLIKVRAKIKILSVSPAFGANPLPKEKKKGERERP